jgi:curved DNA-binding protein CbpA
MDYRLSLHEFEESKSSSKDDEFKPLELIRSMIHLPNEFLCDSGYIYSTIFQRPPTTVVREALQMVVQKAFEKSPSSLGVEQINLAIKQLRIDNLQIDMKSVDEMDSFGVITIDDITDDDPSSSSSASASPPAAALGSAEEEFFRLQIMIELIRMHIVSTNKRNDERAAQLAAVDHDDDLDDPQCSSTFDLATSNAAAALGSSIDESLLDKAPGSHSKLDIRAIESHLRTPMQEVLENAEKMSPDDLEGANASLKPYLKQLSGLKASLTMQLKDLQDSRAFLALGLSSDATDDDIKKAYRTLAIRLHPDKPGGDTARFQQLQDAYQEIMKRRKSDKAEHDAMEEVRRRRSPPQQQQQEHQQESKKSDGNKSGGKKTNDRETTDGESVRGDVADDGDGDDDEDGAKVENDDVDTINAVDAEIFDGDGSDARKRIEEGKERKKKDTARGNNNDDNNDANDDSEEEFEELLSEIKKFRIESANDECEGDDGVGPKVYLSEAEHAQAILKQITEVLVHIKHAAGQCTQLAQLNIKWYKMIEKAMEQPNAFKEVYKLVIACTGSKSVLKRANVKSLISNIEACALHQAITPVESLCEWAQKISALAMELPNNCGMQYASAAAANKTFIQTIERSMHLSLSALKTVLSLISTQEQLASCMRRVKDSMKLASDNMEIQDLLLEMVRTGVKSNVITMSNTGKH